MPGSYTHTTRASGFVLTASAYNADHENHITHLEPQYIDDHSANLAAMQTVTDPGELAAEDLAESLGGELERLRYAVQDLKSFYDSTLTRWYQTPTRLSLALGTLTADKPVLNGTATWNESGTTFNALKVNITDTTSAAASKLLDLQVASSSKFSVTKAGLVTAASSLVAPTIGPNASQVHTLPAVTSDTVALVAATQTLTNKTLTSPILTSPTANTTLTLGDACNVVLNTTTGSKIGTATSQKLGFYNATPVVQPGAYTQTYSTADKTHAAPTASTLTVTDGTGTNDNTIGAITADASVIAAVQEIVDEVNKLIVDVADVKQLANSIIDDLQQLGLVG